MSQHDDNGPSLSSPTTEIGPPDNHEFRLLGWFALAVLFAVQVSGLYTEQAGVGATLFPGADRAGHLLMFLAPALLAQWMRLPGVVLLLAAHALLSEPLQGWLTSTRTPDVWDTFFDVVGLGLGVWLAQWWRHRCATRAGGMDP